MGKRAVTGLRWLGVLGLTAWLACACAPVDRWDVFDPDFDKPLHEKGHGARDIQRFQKEMVEGLPFETPSLQEPLKLSIEDVTLMALQNNQDLRVQQINPVIAGTYELIERGVFDPELFAEFGYAEEVASESSRATGQKFDVESTEIDTVAGIRQDLPSGTTLEASVEYARDRSNRAPDQRSARAGLSMTQALLQGFGPAVNLVSIRQAELDTLASMYELQGFTETLVAETEVAYWKYVLALQEISIFESSLAIARQQRDEIEQQIDVGLLPETEGAAARAEVALREQALIDARSLLEERRLRLLRLINVGQNGHLDNRLEATSEPMIEPEPINDQAERLALAQQSRPDLEEALLRMRQDRLETIVTRNGLLPKLDVFIQLGRTGYADSLSGSFRELDSNTYDFAAGLRLSRPLGNRAARGRHELAQSTYSQAREAVRNLRQIIRLDVRLAVNEVQRTRQQITASEATRRLEEQTARAEEERFDVGSSTALLVAQAQRDLLASQIAEVRAIIEYRIAMVELYLAEGSLLQRRGIVIGDPPVRRDGDQG